MRRLISALLSASIAALLAIAVLGLPAPAFDVSARVAEQLPRSGASHPVTAVLLNFRGYDTLLEIAVLLVAVTAGLALRTSLPDRVAPRSADAPSLVALLHGVVPLMVLVAGFLLWAGAQRPGGAFQAGAVAAAAGILLRLTGVPLPGTGPVALRIGLVGGLVVFVAVAVGALFGERHLLSYPPASAGALIVVIETTLTVSIGFILLSLFAAPPSADHGPGRR